MNIKAAPRDASSREELSAAMASIPALPWGHCGVEDVAMTRSDAISVCRVMIRCTAAILAKMDENAIALDVDGAVKVSP